MHIVEACPPHKDFICIYNHAFFCYFFHNCSTFEILLMISMMFRLYMFEFASK